jgi:hypothetical protein
MASNGIAITPPYPLTVQAGQWYYSRLTRDPVSTMQAGKGSHVIIYMARKAIQGDDWQDSDGGEEAQTNVTVQSTEML